MNRRLIWTDAENDILRAHYPAAETSDALLPLLPTRTAQGIRMQAGRLGLKRANAPGGWSGAHFAILKAYYPTQGAAYVAQRVGRTPDRVRGQACEHGIKFIRPPRPPKAEKKKPGPRPGAIYRPRATKAPAAKVAATPKPRTEKPTQKASPMPGVQTNPRTPNLNAAKAARIAQARQREQEKATQKLVTADELKAAGWGHPASQAYARAARTGNGVTASLAFRQVMEQQKGGAPC